MAGGFKVYNQRRAGFNWRWHLAQATYTEHSRQPQATIPLPLLSGYQTKTTQWGATEDLWSASRSGAPDKHKA